MISGFVYVLLLGFCFLFGFQRVCWLFPWPAQLLCSRGMPAGVAGWGTGISGEKEGWRKMSLGSFGVGPERKGRPLSVSCWQAGNETGGGRLSEAVGEV